jgi:hypothetical protein
MRKRFGICTQTALNGLWPIRDDRANCSGQVISRQLYHHEKLAPVQMTRQRSDVEDCVSKILLGFGEETVESKPRPTTHEAAHHQRSRHSLLVQTAWILYQEPSGH